MKPPPKCHLHGVELELIRVEASQGEFVTDIHGYPRKVKHQSEPGRRAVQFRKQ